ncbi:iron-containing alcohol dehydrogenase family protein [Aquibacillus sediminis]|uniref:iron-containing alcohol dehydrogenase family protein n=1 Tax=Aquibacillus sediminis TaxID=2574734 RepID=UPI00110941A7|nr:iron-containing alcohol dehydrogenase family protein [Aquibacillus sediminis]
MDPLQIQGAPSFYQCAPGVLEQLPSKISEQPFHHGLIIHGDASWQVAKKHVPSLPTPITYTKYHGECTEEEVERIHQVVQNNQVDYIIGVGGGKIMDIAKACGHSTNLPVILIPTLASNCAVWTPLSVFYDQQGNFVNYKIFPRSTLMVLLDPNVIIDSPISYLRAGIGDTIAKWYEADVLTRSLSEKPIALDISLHAARLCRDVLIDHGVEAIQSLQQSSVTTAFTKVVETIIMAGGMVGGYGDKYGRIAGAHSIHNGLTHVEETHDYLHGDKVAFGILVQLALEERQDEIKQLIPFYKEMKLPLSLYDLGIQKNQDKAIEITANAATQSNESIHLMNISQPDQVKQAIDEVEELIASTPTT